MSNELDPLIIGLIIGGIAIAIGIGLGISRHLRNRLPAQGWRLVVGRPALPQRGRRGRLSLVLVGTYGVKEGVRICESFQRANCLDEIGGILVVEFNEGQLEDFQKKLPSELARRVVTCDSELLSGGLGNRTIEAVNSPHLRQLWAPEIRAKVAQFCALLRHTEFTHIEPGAPAISDGYDPNTFLVLVSTGGHLLLGLETARWLQREFRDAQMYAITILGEDEAMRQELAKGLEWHARQPVFRHWLPTDNRLARARQDRGVATVLASIWQSWRLLEHSHEPFNILSHLENVTVLRYWERQDLPVLATRLPPPIHYLPVLATRLLPPVYYTFKAACIRAVLDGIEAVDETTARCVALPSPAARTTRYVVVTIPLYKESLAELRLDIEARLEESGWLGQDPNRHLIFASLAVELTAATRQVPMSVALLETAEDGLANLRKLALTEELAVPEVAAPQPDGAKAAERALGG